MALRYDGRSAETHITLVMVTLNVSPAFRFWVVLAGVKAHCRYWKRFAMHYVYDGEICVDAAAQT